MKLCSACLLGVKCRYDGKGKPHKAILRLFKRETLIPVCPEELGGLSTPRNPSERNGKKVIMKPAKDVTQNFKKGAEEVLKIAEKLKIKKVIFKQRSASCGSGRIYDGTFSGKIIKGDGVATELLKKHGIKVISEDEIK